MQAGEPLTRIVTLSALGQIETQLPAIEAPEVDGLNVYTDQPELGRETDAGGIRGIRRDQFAVIGLAGGDVALPAVEVPWWNIETGEWQLASLPARTLTISGAAAPVPEPPATEPAVEEAAASAPAASGEAAVAVNAFWQRATEMLAVLWLLTVAAWWWSSRTRPRRRREPREPQEAPVHKQQARLIKAARRAAAAGDGAAVRAALLDWGKLQWPDDAPRSIGEIALRVEAPLADELGRLSAASYGRNGGGWDGAALASALKSIAIRPTHAPAEDRDILPPLMPPAR